MNTANRLLRDTAEADLTADDLKVIHRQERRDRRRHIRDLRRVESAKAAIEGLDQRTEIFGFTKGQFSLVQLPDLGQAKQGTPTRRRQGVYCQLRERTLNCRPTA